MSLSIKALSLGHKHLAEVIRSGRAIPPNLETCLRDGDQDKVLSLADPHKIDAAFQMVWAGAEDKINTEERRNWYFWAKPRGRRTSADLGAENVFKEFYRGESLTDEEKKVVLGVLAIRIEEELHELKKERDIIKR
jgi:hypothetical protein